VASVTVIFAGQEQKNHELVKPRIVVGREASCDIQIDNLGISRNHCAFVNKGEAFLVQDLNSSNGTYVNGLKITERFLNDGDEIIIGKYTLKFKNEAHSGEPPKEEGQAGPEIPDSLNTYVMEGGEVRAQVAKLRASQQSGAQATPSTPPVGATAKDYAQALDPGQAAAKAISEMSKLKSLLVALLAIILVLLVFIVLLLFGVIPIGGFGK